MIYPRKNFTNSLATQNLHLSSNYSARENINDSSSLHFIQLGRNYEEYTVLLNGNTCPGSTLHHILAICDLTQLLIPDAMSEKVQTRLTFTYYCLHQMPLPVSYNLIKRKLGNSRTEININLTPDYNDIPKSLSAKLQRPIKKSLLRLSVEF